MVEIDPEHTTSHVPRHRRCTAALLSVFYALCTTTNDTQYDMRGPAVDVNVSRYPRVGAKSGIKYISVADRDGTFAELRAVLRDDGVMLRNDKFCVRHRLLGKSYEEKAKWAQLIEVRRVSFRYDASIVSLEYTEGRSCDCGVRHCTH